MHVNCSYAFFGPVVNGLLFANKQTKQKFTKWSSVNVVVWIVSPVMAQRNSACHTFLFLSLIIRDKLAFANYNCHFEWYLRLRSTNAGGQFQIREKEENNSLHSNMVVECVFSMEMDQMKGFVEKLSIRNRSLLIG